MGWPVAMTLGYVKHRQPCCLIVTRGQYSPGYDSSLAVLSHSLPWTILTRVRRAVSQSPVDNTHRGTIHRQPCCLIVSRGQYSPGYDSSLAVLSHSLPWTILTRVRFIVSRAVSQSPVDNTHQGTIHRQPCCLIVSRGQYSPGYDSQAPIYSKYI